MHIHIKLQLGFQWGTCHFAIRSYRTSEAPFSASIGSRKSIGIYADLAGTEVLATDITTLKQTQANR
ncbi:hypothetical protein GCM10008023_37040 [Sphingomonas glacialis]|uniref:Uncharacterized protein n=1 Tax=Sphingomonas glacialis TaxID=658225 RepID=A0ABQ3LS42_9SPHN|nr:hypothetical protein GCM10008023_37040 [Sphingomonas glacialis]